MSPPTPALTFRVFYGFFFTCHQPLPLLGVSSVSFSKCQMKFLVASFLAKLAATPTFWLLPFLSLNNPSKSLLVPACCSCLEGPGACVIILAFSNLKDLFPQGQKNLWHPQLTGLGESDQWLITWPGLHFRTQVLAAASNSLVTWEQQACVSSLHTGK